MLKKQIIILIVVIILIFGGIIGWGLLRKSKIFSGGGIKQGQEEPQEVLNLSGIVSNIDIDNNFLIVKPVGPDKELKVAVSETTKLIKLEFPFDPDNPPEGASFAPEETQIKISDFQIGDNVFIKTKTNIAGKDEFDDVDFIHILP